MEILKYSLNKKYSYFSNIKNKNLIKKHKGNINNIQINNDNLLNAINSKNKNKPIYIMTQRNYKETDIEKSMLVKNQKNLKIKDSIKNKIRINVFSSKQLEQSKKLNINLSKLPAKQYKNNCNNYNENSSYLKGISLNVNQISLNNIISSLSYKNKDIKRNSLHDLKCLCYYNKIKYNSNSNINNNININTLSNYSDINDSNFHLNDAYFINKGKNKNINLKNNNNLNSINNLNNISSKNIINRNDNIRYNINNLNNTKKSFSNDYIVNYFNKQNYKNNNSKNKKKGKIELTKDNDFNENTGLLINNYAYKNIKFNLKNCKSLLMSKDINSISYSFNDIDNNSSLNDIFQTNTNKSNIINKNYYAYKKPSILIEENPNTTIKIDNKSYFNNNKNITENNSSLKDKISKTNFFTINYDNNFNNKDIKSIYSKKKLKINNINKIKKYKKKDIKLLTDNHICIFSPIVKIKNKGNYIYSNNNSNIKNNTSNFLSKNIDNKLNHLNININNYSNINNTISGNNTMSNYNTNKNKSIKSYNNIYHSISENQNNIPMKKKILNQNQKSSNLSNSHNNIIILNNISLNNLESNYISKLTKKYYPKNFNSISNIHRQIYNYVSKEKKISDNQNEIDKQKNYYNNQKKIYHKKNNNKNNRINDNNIIDANFDIKSNYYNIYTNNISIKNEKNKLNINNNNEICKNNNKNKNTINKIKVDNISNLNNNINHVRTKSSNFNFIIDMQKINNNLINKNFHKAMNSFTYNNPKNINQILKELKKILKNNNETSLKINSVEVSPIKNNNNGQKYFLKKVSKEKNNNNNLLNLSDKILIKIKNPKKKINNNELKLKNKINAIKKQLLNQKNQELNINLNIHDKSKNIMINNDNNSKNNPQYAYEYTKDIIESILIEENYYFNEKKYINPFYLDNEESELTPEMRTVAVDWLVLIHYKIFKFEENTLFLTIQIFDRYLSKVIVNTDRTELLLLSSFILASKHNEIDYVNMKEALQLSKNKFSKKQIINMEYEILNIIDFEILSPTMCEFFTIFANYLNLNNEKINEGLYLLNIMLVDYHMLEYPNFLLALGVIKLITNKINKNLMKIIVNILKEKKMKGFYNYININNEEYESFFMELCEKMKLLYKTFIETKYKNIIEKFSGSKYNFVSINSDFLLSFK